MNFACTARCKLFFKVIRIRGSHLGCINLKMPKCAISVDQVSKRKKTTAKADADETTIQSFSVPERPGNSTAWIFSDWVSRVLNGLQTLWVVRISLKSYQNANNVHIFESNSFLISWFSNIYALFPGLLLNLGCATCSEAFYFCQKMLMIFCG